MLSVYSAVASKLSVVRHTAKMMLRLGRGGVGSGGEGWEVKAGLCCIQMY